MRTLDARVDVIRNGSKITEVYPVDMPTITEQANAVIKSSMSGTFLFNKNVDWLIDELQPIAIIDGVEYPFGVFAPSTVSLNRRENLLQVNVEAYDRCWKVQAIRTENILHLAAGTNYIDAVVSLLSMAGITLINKTPTWETLTSDREDWDIGTDLLTIINQLLDEINYNELWFDANGMAVLEPDRLFDVTQVEREYDYYSVKTLMLDGSSMLTDLFNAPNVFLCVCSNPDKTGVLTATAENNNYASPLSIPRRGKRIMSMVKVNNIASQEALNDYAQILVTESMFTGKSIDITTAIMPNCGVNDVIALNHPDADGICIETGWSLQLGTGGTMKHTLLQQPKADIVPQPVIRTGTIAGVAIAGINVVGVAS